MEGGSLPLASPASDFSVLGVRVALTAVPVLFLNPYAQLRTCGAAGSGSARWVVWTLSKLLRDRALRCAFVKANGPPLLVPLLTLSASSPANIQVSTRIRARQYVALNLSERCHLVREGMSAAQNDLAMKYRRPRATPTILYARPSIVW